MSFVAFVHLLSQQWLPRSPHSAVGILVQGLSPDDELPPPSRLEMVSRCTDKKCVAAQLKVQRLEAALVAFGDEVS